MTIYYKADIIIALDKNITAFNKYIGTLNREQFEYRPLGKWSAGQNLEHLIRSIKPVNLAFGLPLIILKLLFGKANRPSKNYEGLIEKYKSKLQAGGKASSRFVPPGISFDKKNELLSQYNNQKDSLIKKIEKSREEDLDKYILPHPLIGKITLREMMFFTIYHNEHHLNILRERN